MCIRDRPYSAYFVGPMTKYSELVTYAESVHQFGVRFLPCGLSCFTKLPLHEFANHRISTNEMQAVFDITFIERLCEQNHVQGRIQVVEEYLLTYLAHNYPVSYTHLDVYKRQLLENNSAVITCDSKSMPVGLMLPLYGNTTQNERFRQQLDASVPLKKQLWQQTIKSKIDNQASVLEKCTAGEVKCMRIWANDVKSGDPDNLEARAAAYYWKGLFANVKGFTREREGISPNNLLNYGYAILRAIVARGLVTSGLLPTLGIHHHNRYNAYCLADDIMEPYRDVYKRQE